MSKRIRYVCQIKLITLNKTTTAFWLPSAAEVGSDGTLAFEAFAKYK
jgi:hypothetical protein